MNFKEARDIAYHAKWDGMRRLYVVEHEGATYSGLSEADLRSNLHAGRTDECWPEESDKNFGGEGIAGKKERFKVSTIDVTTGKAYGGPQPHIEEERVNFHSNMLKEDCSSTASACLPKSVLKALDEAAFGGKQAPPFGKKDDSEDEEEELGEDCNWCPEDQDGVLKGDEDEEDVENLGEADVYGKVPHPGKNYKKYFGQNSSFLDKEAELGRPLEPHEFPEHDNSDYHDAMIDFENDQLAKRGLQNCGACGDQGKLGLPCASCGYDNDTE